MFRADAHPQARLDILKIHSRKMNLTRGINLKKIADQLTNASGAEIKAVCTGAKPRHQRHTRTHAHHRGWYVLRERRVHVNQEDFEMAVAKVMKKDTEKNMSLKKLWK